MKPQTVALLAIVLAGLGALYFYLQQPEKIDQEQLYTQVVPQFDKDTIVEISAHIPAKEGEKGHPLHLVRKEGRWLVQRWDKEKPYWAPAKEEKFGRLLAALRGLAGEKRASGKDLFATFALDKDQAMRVELKKSGGGKIALEIGKRGPRWNSSFVKRPGSDDIYICSQNLLSLFEIWSEKPAGSLSARPWTEKTIVAEGPGEVEGVSYTRGTLEWSLVAKKDEEQEDREKARSEEKEEGSKPLQYVFNYNGEAGSRTEEEARKILQGFLPLHGNDVVNPSRASDYGLGPGQQSGRLTIHMKGKGVKILHVGLMDEKAQKGWIEDGRGNIYEVGVNVIKKIENPIGPEKDTEKAEKSKK